jgi:hypothetical protein
MSMRQLKLTMLGKFLAWRWGNGRLVHIGADAIIGCGNATFLTEQLIHPPQNMRDITLNKLSVWTPQVTPAMEVSRCFEVGR